MCIPMEARVLGNSNGGREDSNPRVPTLGVGKLGNDGKLCRYNMPTVSLFLRAFKIIIMTLRDNNTLDKTTLKQLKIPEIPLLCISNIKIHRC